MNKKSTSFLITTSVLIVIVLFAILFIVLIDKCLRPYYTPNKEIIENYLQQDKENLVIIKDYFMDNPIASDISDMDYRSKNYSKLIKDEKIDFAFKYLFEKQGYKKIGKQRNYIYFLKWTRGSNLGIGIIYTIDHKAPKLEKNAKSENLSETGWYYYEEN